MKIVLDTNILLQFIANANRLRSIWNAFLNAQFKLYITPAIFLEYEEKLSEKTSTRLHLI
jgi:predicted nucleic acid-binding protein